MPQRRTSIGKEFARAKVEVIVTLFTVATLDRDDVELGRGERAELGFEQNVALDGHVVERRTVANGTRERHRGELGLRHRRTIVNDSEVAERPARSHGYLLGELAAAGPVDEVVAGQALKIVGANDRRAIDEQVAETDEEIQRV